MSGITRTGIGRAVRSVLEAYAKRLRTNNPKTDALRMRKQALRTYGYLERRKVLVNLFVKAAAKQFAAGNVREARRFYDGAFEFGNKDQVRGKLLAVCTAMAAAAFRAGDHDAVWNLLAAARFYHPLGMCRADVNSLFGSKGVVISELRRPSCFEPLQRLQSVRDLLPEPLAA